MTAIRRPTALHIKQASSADALRDQSRDAADAGFDGVELSASLLRPGARAPAASMVDAFAAGGGAQVAAVAASLAPTDIAAGRDELVSLLGLAADLGAQCLNLAIPLAGQPATSEGASTRYRDAINFVYQLLSRCRLDAEAAGVAIGLEAAAGGCLVSPVELRELLNAVNSWSVGACVDTHRIGGRASPADWALTLTHRVHTVRVHDAAPPVSGDTEANDAQPEWRRFGDALDQMGYDRLLVIAGDRTPKELRESLTSLEPRVSTG